MRINQRGDVFIPGIIALVTVFGLFVAYVSGHPLPWNQPKVQTQPYVEPTPIRVPEDKPVVVDVEPEVAAKVAENG